MKAFKFKVKGAKAPYQAFEIKAKTEDDAIKKLKKLYPKREFEFIGK